MRQIGTLPTQDQAELLADFLLTEGIVAQAEVDGKEWAIWVREEGQVERARGILGQFVEDPRRPKYREAVAEAERIRTVAMRQRAKASRNLIDVRQRWNQPLSRRAPLVFALIGLSVFASLATGFGGARQSSIYNALLFCDLRIYQQTGDALLQIKQGQIWRLITPIFLHGGLLHLGFNMMWLYYLGTQIEMRRGTVQLGWMVFVVALVSNLAQYFIDRNPQFLGMSGVAYGLFGYIWIRQRIDPQSGFFLGESTVFIMLFFLVLGFAGALDSAVGGVANWAHAGGLAAGVALATIYPRRL